MTEEITLRADVAHLARPDGNDIMLALSDFAEGIAEQTVQGLHPQPLTDFMRWNVTAGPIRICILELPPELRVLSWLSPESPAPFGEEAVTTKRQLATPFVVIKVPFKHGQLLPRVEVFYRVRPVSNLDGPGGQLYLPNLLNVSPGAYGCIAWFCTQHLQWEGGTRNVAAALDSIIHHLWGGSFNASSEHHEGQSTFGLAVQAQIDPRVGSVERWEEESLRDPGFVLNVPWQDAGVTVRQLVERELSHWGGDVPPLTVTDYASILLRRALPR